MKRYISTSLTVALLGLAIMWVGCAHKKIELDGEIPDQDVPSTGIPDWFLNIPEDPNYMYAVTTTVNKNLEMGLDTAKHQAKADLTSQLETKVAGMFKRFREDIGAGEEAELTAMATAVTKEVYSDVLSGAKPLKQEVLKEGNLYNVYLLYELPIGSANVAVVDKVKANKNLYTRFRASEGFKDLEKEVEKYEAWKKRTRNAAIVALGISI